MFTIRPIDYSDCDPLQLLCERSTSTIYCSNASRVQGNWMARPSRAGVSAAGQARIQIFLGATNHLARANCQAFAENHLKSAPAHNSPIRTTHVNSYFNIPWLAGFRSPRIIILDATTLSTPYKDRSVQELTPQDDDGRVRYVVWVAGKSS